MVDNCFAISLTRERVASDSLFIFRDPAGRERFIRGDESRTTEGSGLGLSIAKNLTIAQGGEFDIRLDGDLFKVVILFDCVEQ